MYLKQTPLPDGGTARAPWWVSDNPYDRDVFRWTPDVPLPATGRK